MTEGMMLETLKVIKSNAPAQARYPRTVFPGLWAHRFAVSPRMETLQYLWENFLPCSAKLIVKEGPEYFQSRIFLCVSMLCLLPPVLGPTGKSLTLSSPSPSGIYIQCWDSSKPSPLQAEHSQLSFAEEIKRPQNHRMPMGLEEFH